MPTCRGQSRLLPPSALQKPKYRLAGWRLPSMRTGQVPPELRANTSTSGSLTAHSKEFLRRTAEPAYRPNACKTYLFEIRTTGGEVRVIRDKLRSETALTASASLRGSDGIGKTARLLGALRPWGRPIAGSRQGSGGRGGIRTHGRVSPSLVFKTSSLNHSDTLPYR